MRFRPARAVPCRALGLCLALMPLLAPGAAAQERRAPGEPLHVRVLDQRDGLSSQSVTSIAEDARGFVWIGTEDGLNRYDGAAFETFRPVPFDSLALRDPGISALVLTSGGTLWALTYAGLHRYDPERSTFPPIRAVPDDAIDLLADPDGSLWVMTVFDGFMRLDPATGRAAEYQLFAPDSLRPHRNAVDAMLRAHDGALWIGTAQDEVHRVSPSALAAGPLASGSVPSQHIGFTLPEEDDPDPRPHTTEVLYQRRDGSIWAGGSAGLLRYDDASEAFVPVPQWAATDMARVYALLEDPGGTLWIASDTGLHRLTPASASEIGAPDVLTSHPHVPGDPTTPPPGELLTLHFSERTGLIWAGGDQGVSVFPWHAPPIEHLGHARSWATLPIPSVWALHTDPDGTLWAGSVGGLYRIDPAERTMRFVEAFGETDVTELYADRSGTLWVSVFDDGIYTLDRATLAATQRFEPDREAPDGLFSLVPWRLHEDARGRFWLMSGIGEGCMSELHRETGRVTRYCHDPDRPHATPADDVTRAVAETPGGVLWIGTWGRGLDRFDPDAGTFTHYRHDPADRDTPAGDFVSALAIAPDSTLWLGFRGAGLSRFDPRTETFEHISTANTALPSDIVYALEFDTDGMLWVASERGLSRLDPVTKSVRTYGAADGVQQKSFREATSFLAADGALYFGSADGVNIVRPETLGAAQAAAVTLTQVTVRGERAEVERRVEQPPLVRLPRRARDVAFTFAAPRFTTPTPVRYRHRLDGFDEGWQLSGNARTAAYTNLDPGTYTFRVQASGPDGQWNEPGAALTVAAAPRFFETGWFLAVVLLGIVGLATALYRAREQRHMRREESLEITVRERTADLREEKRTTEAQAERLAEAARHKSRFFTNVSHEFRTPLTLTIGPLEDLERAGDLAPRDREHVRLALRNSRRLLRLTNQLLDVAKLEIGALRLDAAQHDLAGFVEALAQPFAPLAARRSVRFSLNAPTASLCAHFDPPKLEQVIVNLLSNAFKFTPEHGSIQILVEPSESEDIVCVTVRDSGVGIEAEHLPHLFERFYQAGRAQSDVQVGTGVGLSLAKDLAELHGGALTVESTLGFGAAFTLTLPLQADEAEDARALALSMRPVERESEPSEASTLSAVPAPPAEDTEEPSDLEEARTTILIADDHADIRHYVRGHLEPRFRVLEAADGAEALALAREALPDLIVSDVMMPRLDGFALTRALKSDPETDFIPVLLLTAKATAEERLEGLGQGADDYLSKPFDVRELLLRVGNRMEQQTRLRQRLVSAQPEFVPPPNASAPPVPSERVGGDGEAVSEFAEQARAIVQAHLHEETFDVEAFAEALGQSRSTLHRRLRDEAGVTPSVLLREARIARAQELLRDGEGTVSEVAYAVGFKSVSHFSGVFRKIVGQSPSAFVERAA